MQLRTTYDLRTDRQTDRRDATVNVNIGLYYTTKYGSQNVLLLSLALYIAREGNKIKRHFIVVTRDLASGNWQV